MARPFDLRDVSAVQRLHANARPLAALHVAVNGIAPLREAMRAYVGGIREAVVCMVDRDSDEGVEAYALMHVMPDASSPDVARPRGAAMILFAPGPTTEPLTHAWISLTNELASAAAERGVHHIVADAQEGGVEAMTLQAAGFAPMLQQDLMKLPHTIGTTHEDVAAVEGLREVARDDEPLIRALHIRCAPKMTYQTEVTYDALVGQLRTHKAWVLVRHNEAVGFVGLWHGRRGRALRCLFRPDVEALAEASIRHALARDPYTRATYCGVRHYQSDLLPVLHSMGFVHVNTTVLMMRHTAAHVRHPVWSVSPELATAKQRPVSYKLNAPGMLGGRRK